MSKRKANAKKAGTAWAQRNKEYRDRRSETIEFPEQALAIWREMSVELDDDRVYGKSDGIGKPKEIKRLAPMVGDRIERQIYDRVEQDRLMLPLGGSLRAAILAWPLPATFYDPVPPLCAADVDAIRRQEADEDLSEARRKQDEERKAGDGDRRPLPGFEREP